MLYLCTRKWGDQVAQSVEHIPFKDGVPGSSPGLVTKKAAFRYLKLLFLLPYGFFVTLLPYMLRLSTCMQVC